MSSRFLFSRPRATLCCSMLAALLFSASAGAAGPQLIQVAQAGAHTIRLATQSREDDPLTQAARRAADDPDPDYSTLQLLESVHRRDQGEWEQAFAIDMGQAFRENAAPISVPFEYRPTHLADGFSIVQLLANAVLRANMPCKSIYSVDSLGDDIHGWILICDRKANGYGVALIGNNWKLHRVSGVGGKPARQAK